MSVRNGRGTELTRAHSAIQAAIGADVARQVVAVWGAVDPVHVERAWPAVSRAMTQVVARGYAASTAAAATYLKAHAAESGVDLQRILTAPAIDLDQLNTALRVTGPVAVKRAAAAGMDPVTAARAAAVQLTGSTSRLAMNGGRATVNSTVAGSDQITGWRRALESARPCYFCAMLASRGAVYKTAETAGAGQHWHDHCHCQPEPLYGHEGDPDDVLRLRDAWQQHASGERDAVNAWRRAYDGGHVHGVPAVAKPTTEASPIIGRDLTKLTDDEVAELLGKAGTDDEVDAVVAELDRRDAVDREAKAADAKRQADKERRDVKRQAEQDAKDAEFDRRIEAGEDPEDVYADVFGVSVAQQRRDQAVASMRSNGYVGRSFDDLSRKAFGDYVNESWLNAENATRGHLFRGHAERSQADVIRLFNGSEAYARANASEELLAYWQEHGRMTLDDFQASLLGGELKRGKATAAFL